MIHLAGNNLTFGTGGKNEKGEHVAGFGYYEVRSLLSQSSAELTFPAEQTIAGGSGAGPTWDGTSGVHVAMTNTRITDPEVSRLV